MIVRSEFSWKAEDAGVTDPNVKWTACIVGLEVVTGKQAWRNEISNGYSTPVVRTLPDGKKEVLQSARPHRLITDSRINGPVTWSMRLLRSFSWPANQGFVSHS